MKAVSIQYIEDIVMVGLYREEFPFDWGLEDVQEVDPHTRYEVTISFPSALNTEGYLMMDTALSKINYDLLLHHGVLLEVSYDYT